MKLNGLVSVATKKEERRENIRKTEIKQGQHRDPNREEKQGGQYGGKDTIQKIEKQKSGIKTGRKTGKKIKKIRKSKR